MSLWGLADQTRTSWTITDNGCCQSIHRASNESRLWQSTPSSYSALAGQTLARMQRTKGPSSQFSSKTCWRGGESHLAAGGAEHNAVALLSHWCSTLPGQGETDPGEWLPTPAFLASPLNDLDPRSRFMIIHSSSIIVHHSSSPIIISDYHHHHL